MIEELLEELPSRPLTPSEAQSLSEIETVVVADLITPAPIGPVIGFVLVDVEGPVLGFFFDSRAQQWSLAAESDDVREVVAEVDRELDRDPQHSASRAEQPT